METIFFLSKFLHFLFFVGLKVPESLKSAKSCVLLLPKGQLFETYSVCKNSLRYQKLSYERAYQNTD